jgi:hypothetical protein
MKSQSFGNAGLLRCRHVSRAEPLRLLRICGVYFVLAALAVRLTRYDGGVAFLWFATPYLTRK